MARSAGWGVARRRRPIRTKPSKRPIPHSTRLRRPTLPSFAGEGRRHLNVALDTDAPQDKLDLLLKLTERYCVVYQTIKNGPKVSVSMQRV